MDRRCIKVFQEPEDLPPDTKRCRMCKEVKPVTEFYRGRGYLNRHSICKECDKKESVRRAALRKPQKRKDLEAYFTVKFDPTATYDRGAIFYAEDFRESLRGNIWPVGMIVERNPDEALFVIGTTILTIEEAYFNQEEYYGL